MIEHLATTSTHGVFARQATYTPPGEDAVPRSVRVIIDLGIQERSGLTSEIIQEGDFVDFLASDDPEMGGILTDIEGHDSKVWRIGRRESDDNHIMRFRILEVQPDE